MCDTLVVVRPQGVLFAKNSDRDANEAQVLDWQPRHQYPRGSTVRCTWIEIPQAAETHAVLLSRPFWMWGAEMGANEHGVVVGNEAVFTRQPRAKTGLTGMDLVRLALERAASAEQAVEVMIALLAEHGQGGGCGYEDRSFTYHSSFLAADAAGAVVLETAGGRWAVEAVAGTRSLSNLLTIPDFARAHSDFLYTRVAAGKVRQCRTQALAEQASGPADLMEILRDHGAGSRAPRYRWLNGTLSAPCMHGGGAVASSVTTASWVAELRRSGARHWVTATAAPCLGLFKPAAVDVPLDLEPFPADRADNSLWWRHERFHRRVLADPERLGALFLAERDEVESRWLAAPPEPAAAFAEGDRLLGTWTSAVAGGETVDVRPFWARRYWRRRDRQAGL